MNKRFLQLLWAIPLLGVLSGCSESEWSENGQNANNSIRFSVTAGKQTRATVTDNGTVTNGDFGLFAYSTDAAWTPGTTTPSDEPDVMNNQKVEYDNSSNVWTYSPLKFWSDKNISFFGYWPKKDGVTDASIPDAHKLPTVKFTQEVTDPASMVDFLVAHALNKTKADGTVVMPFRHALTRLNFQARLDDNWGTKLSDDTKILVKSLKVLGGDDSRFFKTATYQLGDGGSAQDLVNGSWSYDGADKVADNAPLVVTSIMATSPTQTIGTDNPYTYPTPSVSVNLDGTNTNLLKPDEYLFMIPPYGSDGIKSDKDVIVEISYDVVTKDDKITVNGGVVTEPTTAKISLPNGKLQEGKAYNIIFTIGLDAIKVDADVTDWDADEAANAPSVDATSSSDTDILAAWKSLNGVKATDKNARYFAINVPGAPTTDIDLSSAPDADIDNFELGDQVELRFNGATFDKTVLCPVGWSYQVHTVDGQSHYVLVKSDAPTVIDDYANITANCYMINMGGKTTYFTLPLSQAKKGWDQISGQKPDIDDILTNGKWKIKTLWKTWSGTTSVTGTKASGYSAATPKATLTIPRNVKNGNNAVVALVSEDEQTVYWSWHLWFTDYAPSSTDGSATNGQVHQYISDAFKQGGTYYGKYMMDRNLGATITGVTGAINQPATTKEAVKYYGLLYQFGRKDPFMGSSDGTSNTMMKRYNADGTQLAFAKEEVDGAASKLADAVQKPTTFFTRSAGGNWTVEKDGLWGEDGTKSVFDPCPPGWRIPKGGATATDNPWAGFRNENSSDVSNGAYDTSKTIFVWQDAKANQAGTAGCIYNDVTNTAWYPATGFVNFYGSLLYVGASGSCWTVLPQSQASGYKLNFNSTNVSPADFSGRLDGRPIRCVQE